MYDKRCIATSRANCIQSYELAGLHLTYDHCQPPPLAPWRGLFFCGFHSGFAFKVPRLFVRVGAWCQRTHRRFLIKLLPTAIAARLLDRLASNLPTGFLVEL